MSDIDFNNVPDEPELAFLFLEDAYYSVVAQTEYDTGPDQTPAQVYLEYMSKTLAARTALNLSILPEWVVPRAGQFAHEVYLSFRQDVVHDRTSMEIRQGRRAKTYSVKLDEKAKATIRHHINQLRELLRIADIPDRKKEALLNRLAAFEAEVERGRTRFEAVGAAFVDFGGYIGEFVEASKFNSVMNSIARVLYGAKTDEQLSLPTPEERRQIEPPRKAPAKKVARGSVAEELDDEIPF